MGMKKTAILVGVAVAVAAVFGIGYVERARTEITENYLQSKFAHDPTIGAYTEALPKIFGGNVKAPFGVLLLHGYSASPQEFDHLVGSLRTAGIPYYAPLLTGFGLDDFRLLEAASPEDWLRDAVNGYQIVAAMAEKVSVVGHSNGGSVAALVAQHHPIDKLILTGPNIFVHPNDVSIKSMVLTPVLSDIAATLMPVFVKPQRADRVTNTDTKDPKGAMNSFHFPALASKSLVTVWTMQDQVDLKKISFEELWLLYGAADQTVDMPSTVAALQKLGIDYQERVFANSGHNILEDYDKDAAVQAILDILVERLAGND